MKILSIKKFNNKYKIDFDNNKYIFITENTLIHYNIVKKIEITENKLNEIIEYEHNEQAFLKSLNYLSYGLRTKFEIKEYLLKKEFTENIIEKTIKKLEQYNYIDDDKYTFLYIKDRFNNKKKGPNYIKKKLEAKGIESETIIKNIDIICSEEKCIDNIYYLIEKEYYKKNEPKNKKIQKITTKLYTNGYNFDIINNTFKIFISNIEENNTDYELIDKYYQKNFNKLSKKYNDKYKLKQKIIEKLFRDGFSYDDIKKYLNEIDF